MTVTRLFDSIQPWFTDAFDRWALGESYTWELVPGVGPSEDGQPVLMFYLYVSQQSPLLNQLNVDFTLIQSYEINEQSTETIVRNAMNRLLQHRSQQLNNGQINI